MLSRALRNCNPGNIRRSASTFRGEVTPSSDAEFKQFESPEWGYRAMFLIIHNYNELYGINTLDRIIGRWAPRCENPTHMYIEVVARRLGVNVNAHIDTLDHDTMVAMVGAMSHIESGEPPIVKYIEKGWQLFAYQRATGATSSDDRSPFS